MHQPSRPTVPARFSMCVNDLCRPGLLRYSHYTELLVFSVTTFKIDHEIKIKTVQ